MIKKFVKDIARNVLYRPKLFNVGKQTYVARPYLLLNRTRISIGSRCTVGKQVIINPLNDLGSKRADSHIEIGDDVYIGIFCQIHSVSGVSFGNGCVLSDHVYISDVAHGLNPTKGLIMQQPLESKGAVKLGNHVFVGYGSSILPGVTLGDHCVVGTRSVVTRSFPAYSMVAGSPAKLIKRYDLELGKWVDVTNNDEMLS